MIAEKGYRIMKENYNVNVIHYNMVQWNDGEVKETSRINTIRISEPIQERNGTSANYNNHVMVLMSR